jgi:hypothetical protein
MVGRVGNGHDDQLDGRVVEQLRERRHDPHGREVAGYALRGAPDTRARRRRRGSAVRSGACSDEPDMP